MAKSKEKKPVSKTSVVVYIFGIVVFISLAFTFDNARSITSSDLYNPTDANTKLVTEKIAEIGPQGGDAVCAALPDTAVHTVTGWPFPLYESYRTESCGVSSGESHPRANQLYNTLIAAGISLTLVGGAAMLMKRSSK